MAAALPIPAVSVLVNMHGRTTPLAHLHTCRREIFGAVEFSTTLPYGDSVCWHRRWVVLRLQKVPDDGGASRTEAGAACAFLHDCQCTASRKFSHVLARSSIRAPAERLHRF